MLTGRNRCSIICDMNISDYLKKHGLSQKRFGEQVGITQGMVWQLLQGMCRASPETAKRIEAATNGEITRAELRPDLWDQPETSNAR